MISCNIFKTDWHTHAAELTHIRTRVFMDEQQVSAADEWDGLDQGAIHFLIQDSRGEAVGCARLLEETDAEGPWFHIGRVAILEHLRNRGLGRQLMQCALDWCNAGNPSAGIYLHAQTRQQGFYQRLGFRVRGGVFMDAGIPHIRMDHHEI